jgi:hypothetical protein
MIDSARLKKAHLTKGGARPMVMHKFYIVPEPTSQTGFDSFRAPA